VDSIIIAQEPKLNVYADTIKRKIASALEILPNMVSVKAKTEEQLGYIGKKKAIAAHAVCLIKKS